VPLALFSDILPIEMKRLMADRLLAISDKKSDYRSVRYTRTDSYSEGVEQLCPKPLHYYVGPESYLLFNNLKIDTSFLTEDVDKWQELPAFRDGQKAARALKVINDSA